MAPPKRPDHHFQCIHFFLGLGALALMAVTTAYATRLVCDGECWPKREGELGPHDLSGTCGNDPVCEGGCVKGSSLLVTFQDASEVTHSPTHALQSRLRTRLRPTVSMSTRDPAETPVVCLR